MEEVNFIKNYKLYYCWEVETENQFEVIKDFGDSVKLSPLKSIFISDQIEPKIVMKKIFYNFQKYRIYRDYEDFIRDYAITFFPDVILNKRDYPCDYPETRALQQTGGFVLQKNTDNSLSLKATDGCFIRTDTLEQNMYNSINIGDFYKYDRTIEKPLKFDEK